MGNTLQNKVIQFHEKIVFDFLKKIRNYLVANPIFRGKFLAQIFFFKIRVSKNSLSNRLIINNNLITSLCKRKRARGNIGIPPFQARTTSLNSQILPQVKIYDRRPWPRTDMIVHVHEFRFVLCALRVIWNAYGKMEDTRCHVRIHGVAITISRARD